MPPTEAVISMRTGSLVLGSAQTTAVVDCSGRWTRKPTVWRPPICFSPMGVPSWACHFFIWSSRFIFSISARSLGLKLANSMNMAVFCAGTSARPLRARRSITLTVPSGMVARIQAGSATVTSISIFCIFCFASSVRAAPVLIDTVLLHAHRADKAQLLDDVGEGELGREEGPERQRAAAEDEEGGRDGGQGTDSQEDRSRGAYTVLFIIEGFKGGGHQLGGRAGRDGGLAEHARRLFQSLAVFGLSQCIAHCSPPISQACGATPSASRRRSLTR